jgi:hypothetical protein
MQKAVADPALADRMLRKFVGFSCFGDLAK